MIDRLPIIGVMGSGTRGYEDLARPLGGMIADYDYHLLTGAGGGVMTTAAQAFTSVENRKGMSLGIVPTRDYDGAFVPRDMYPNPYIEVPIITPLDIDAEKDRNPFSRNYVNIMTSNALVVLPGDHGTRNEVSIALQYAKPMVLFGDEADFKNFPEQTTRVSSMDAVREFLETVQAKYRTETMKNTTDNE